MLYIGADNRSTPSVEGPSLEDFDARESVASWFKGQRSRRPNYRSWPYEGHVTAMEDSS